MTLKRRRVWDSGAIVYWGFWIALASTELGCGSSNDGSPSGSGGDGNAGNGNAGTGGAVAAPSCDGAFARLPAPYSPNTAFDDMSAFIVDAKGLVFSALPDGSLGADASEQPNRLMASDLSGNLTTLRESAIGMFSSAIFEGDDVIVTEGFIGRDLVRIPRAGGDATVLAEGIRIGPVADSTSLYYFGDGDGGSDAVLYSLPRAGGAAKVLANRGSVGIRGFTLDGDTLYWGEEGDILAQDPVSIYSMKVSATQPTLLATIPSDTSGALAASGGVLFSTLISESFEIDTFRVDAGTDPAPMGETGLPFILADGNAYYGNSSGLIRNSLGFDASSVVSGTSGKSIYAVASGPTDLWYATLGCIFRTSK